MFDPRVGAGVMVAVGDPGRTRIVMGSVILLSVLGLLLIAGAVWLIRFTRPDPEELMPLELMSDRTWRRADPVFQRRMLDEARPPGALPLHHMPPVPEPDLEFDRGPDPAGLAPLLDADQAPVVDESIEPTVDQPGTPTGMPPPPPPVARES